MKKLLPILLCYVLMTSQVFAISGGPQFGGGALSPVGTYSGVMIPGMGTTNSSSLYTAPPVALGLFSISVPTSQVATGAFLLFESDTIFTGNFDASVDPDSGQLAGIAFGYDYQQVVGTDTTGAAISVTEEEGYAVGSVVAKIGGSGKNAISTATITGEALLSVTFLAGATDLSGHHETSAVLPLIVSGYRQSFTASTVSGLPTIGSTTTTQ